MQGIAHRSVDAAKDFVNFANRHLVLQEDLGIEVGNLRSQCRSAKRREHDPCDLKLYHEVCFLRLTLLEHKSHIPLALFTDLTFMTLASSALPPRRL